MIKVGIVEDEKQIRDSLEILIHGAEGFTCTHTFSTAEAAIDAIPKLELDVVLMDIHLPGKSGIACISELKDKCPNMQFIMCTSLEDTDSVFSALRAGATGYLTKTTPPIKILEALSDVVKGGSPMSSSIARKVVTSFLPFEKKEEAEKLSKREREILDYLAKGLRYKEISEKLFLSQETVRTHIRNIYEKLQVNSRTEALNKVFSK